jgi:hypothetical protein
MTFALYKGGTKVWQETQSVDVVDGVFNVLLGKVTPLDTVRFNEAIDLGIKVGADPEMSPRTPLAGAAYARALPGLYSYYAEDVTYRSQNLIGGAPNNRVHFGVVGGTISGGGGFEDTDPIANQITHDYGTVGGGADHIAGRFGTIGGGWNNNATGQYSTVAGGSNNKVYGDRAAVLGGDFNYATGNASVILGGMDNEARGSHSLAAGYNAHAKHEGTFVWNDRSLTSGNDSLLSTDTNQFIVRAVNGVGINQAPENRGIHLKQTGPDSVNGIRLEYDSDNDHWDTWVDIADDYNFAFNGTWLSFIEDFDGKFYQYSDQSLKQDIEPYGEVLSDVMRLRPATYRMKAAASSAPKSLGFVAQEVEPFFPELVAEKDGLKALDYAGFGVVAIKAIQELYAEVQSLRLEVAALQDQLDRSSR